MGSQSGADWRNCGPCIFSKMMNFILFTVFGLAYSSPLQNQQHQHGHPPGVTEPGNDCKKFTGFHESLLKAGSSLDLNYKPIYECTIPTVEVLKKCVRGLHVNAQCVDHMYKKLTEEGSVLQHWKFQRRKRTRLPASHIGGSPACYHNFHDNFNHYLNYNFSNHFHDNFSHDFNDNKYYHNYNHYHHNYNHYHNFHHNSTSSQAQKEKVDVADFFKLIYVELY